MAAYENVIWVQIFTNKNQVAFCFTKKFVLKVDVKTIT